MGSIQFKQSHATLHKALLVEGHEAHVATRTSTFENAHRHKKMAKSAYMQQGKHKKAALYHIIERLMGPFPLDEQQ